MSVAGPTKGVTRLLTRDEFGWGTRCVRWYCAAASAARGNHLCFFSLSLLSSKRKRGEFWGRRRIFSLGFVQAFLPVVFVVFLFFFQRRVGETFRLHDDVSFFSTREQSVDDSGDSLQRRHDVSCVYRGSSFSSLSPSSRACTACGVFLKMVLFVGQTSFMFWCMFFPLMRLFILFSAKSHASSPFRHQKKNYRSSSIVLSSSSSDPRRRNKNPKGFHTFLFLHFCLRRDTNAHTSALLIA